MEHIRQADNRHARLHGLQVDGCAIARLRRVRVAETRTANANRDIKLSQVKRIKADQDARICKHATEAAEANQASAKWYSSHAY
jgi:hypothetical protein